MIPGRLMSAPAQFAASPPTRRPVEPIDPQVTTIQPGGGTVMRLELAWGRVRRAILRAIFPGYVRQMAQVRQGEQGGCPFDPIDARDTKYYQNQGTYRWPAQYDRYRWRDRLPFVRAGLCELIVIGGGFLALSIVAGLIWWPLAIAPAVITVLVVWFFRNPRRSIPAGPGQVVAPADGKVVLIEQIEDPEIGRAMLIGIFLSIFNVHANRSPIAGRIIGLRYREGKFLNALRPESARENEQLELRIEADDAPHRLMKVRQITGAIARRIVCWNAPGDTLQRGEMFGMIKLGSRTELVMPWSEELEIAVQLGQKIKAGSTLMATYHPSPIHPNPEQSSE